MCQCYRCFQKHKTQNHTQSPPPSQSVTNKPTRYNTLQTNIAYTTTITPSNLSLTVHHYNINIAIQSLVSDQHRLAREKLVVVMVVNIFAYFFSYFFLLPTSYFFFFFLLLLLLLLLLLFFNFLCSYVTTYAGILGSIAVCVPFLSGTTTSDIRGDAKCITGPDQVPCTLANTIYYTTIILY